ncbi:MAG: hypothetical protein Q8M29_05675 [Bacteroidota bacterium]|nr:hypothetical protein [Bacteroidota bacterium]
MEITYESIKSLIKSEVWEGNQVKLKFQSNDQAQAIETIGMAMPDQEEMMKKIMAEVAKSTASSMAINTGANALGSMMGGMGSTVAGMAVSGAQAAGLGYQMDPTKMMQVELTDEVKQKTILAAFMNLQMFYEFRENNWHYKQPA